LTKSALSAWLCLSLLILLIILPGGVLTRLDINNAPEIYMPAQAPSVILEQELRAQFPSDQVLLALFEGEEIFADGFLMALRQVVQQLEAHPQVERVLTVTNIEHIAASSDGFVVEPLVDVTELAGTTPQQRQDKAIADRFARQLIVALDGTALALIVRPFPLENSFQREELLNVLLDALRAADLTAKTTAVAGQIALDVSQLESMQRDNALFVPVITLLGWMLLWLLFRRVLAMVLGGLAMAVTSSVTLSLLVLIDQPFTLVSVILPSLIAALTLALLIHFYNALTLASRRGLQGAERVARALDEVRRPALFTALTTAAGLASLGLSPIPPISVFGLVAAAGALVVYGVVMYLLPPIFAHWDRRPWPKGKSVMNWISVLVDKLAAVGIRHARAVVIVTVLLLAAGVPMIWQVQAETDLYRFFAPEHPIIQYTQRVEERLSGVTSLRVVFDAPGRDALKEPDRLQAIAAFQAWAEQLPEVDRALSMVDIVEEMHWAFHGEDPAYRRLPDNRDLISQYLFVYDGQDLYDVVNREFQRALVNLNVNVHPAQEITAVMEQISAYLEAAELAGMSWQIGGFGRWFADQHDLLIIGQIRSLCGALILIFGFMCVLWRSVPAAALCMLPNISPILLIFIVMGTFGIWLDMATAMIASVAVGVAVDDTIHFYAGYNRRRAAGAPTVWALMRAYRVAGRAVLATTLVLSVQFLLLTTSAFQPTAYFGLLTTIGLVAALLFDLLLLPALLTLLTTTPRTAGRAALSRST